MRGEGGALVRLLGGSVLLMPDWILPTDVQGVFHGEGLVPIDAAHRSGVPHRGAWLHLLTLDGHLLLVRRSAQMATCPGTTSIIGEHHYGRESDEQCAHRAIREELPGIAALVGTPRLALSRLRPVSRWFLFDYPPRADGSRRYDRCLISEYVLQLRANASEALSLLTAGRPEEHEHEASQMEFVPLGVVVRRLRRSPLQFCAPELLPAALLDSYGDLCSMLRSSGRIHRTAWPLPAGCSRTELFVPVPASNHQTALPERLDLDRIVQGRNHSGLLANDGVGSNWAGRSWRQLRGSDARRSHSLAPRLAARVPAGAKAERIASAATTGTAASLVRQALKAAGLN